MGVLREVQQVGAQVQAVLVGETPGRGQSLWQTRIQFQDELGSAALTTYIAKLSLVEIMDGNTAGLSLMTNPQDHRAARSFDQLMENIWQEVVHLITEVSVLAAAHPLLPMGASQRRLQPAGFALTSIVPPARTEHTTSSPRGAATFRRPENSPGGAPVTPSMVLSAVQARGHIKLVDLPTFSGDMEDFWEFREVFTSLVKDVHQTGSLPHAAEEPPEDDKIKRPDQGNY